MRTLIRKSDKTAHVHNLRDIAHAYSAATPCDIVFKTIATDCLSELWSVSQQLKSDDADAIHRMRILLTRLRTAIRFFSPMLDRHWIENCDKALVQPRKLLSLVREADIAIQRGHPAGEEDKRWHDVRQRNYRQLHRYFRSKKYSKLIEALTRQIATKKAFHISAESESLAGYTPRRLDAWTRKLLRSSRNLKALAPRKLHRVRIKSKRLRYALEWSLAIGKDRELRNMKRALKLAKHIQRELGHLADASAHRDYAKAEQLTPLRPLEKLDSRTASEHILKKVAHSLNQLHACF